MRWLILFIAFAAVAVMMFFGMKLISQSQIGIDNETANSTDYQATETVMNSMFVGLFTVPAILFICALVLGLMLLYKLVT